jgi:excisionase family DNA binding protein
VSACPDLARLLADPARAAEVPLHHVQELLDELGAHEARIRLVRDMLILRLLGGKAAPSPSDGQPVTVTQQEAARRLGVKLRTVEEAVRRRELPHVRLGKHKLIPVEALSRLARPRNP